MLQKVLLEVVVPPDIAQTGSTDTTVIENRSAQLECKARGVPKPTVVWKREDGKEIVIRSQNNERNRSKTMNLITNSRANPIRNRINDRNLRDPTKFWKLINVKNSIISLVINGVGTIG